jgi:preprotein translocase subunit SecE
MAGQQIVETPKLSTLESIKLWPQQTKSYYEELRQEMRRVTWPSRAQVQATTLVVILTVFAFAAYFKVVDEVIARTVTRLYSELSK